MFCDDYISLIIYIFFQLKYIFYGLKSLLYPRQHRHFFLSLFLSYFSYPIYTHSQYFFFAYFHDFSSLHLPCPPRSFFSHNPCLFLSNPVFLSSSVYFSTSISHSLFVLYILDLIFTQVHWREKQQPKISQGKAMYICSCVCWWSQCIYIYIYIQRERERMKEREKERVKEREREWNVKR